MAPFLSRRDLQFQLYEVLDTASLPARSRFADHSREVYDDVLGLAYNVADKYFANHAREADLNEPQRRSSRGAFTASRSPEGYAHTGSPTSPLSLLYLRLPLVVTLPAMVPAVVS